MSPPPPSAAAAADALCCTTDDKRSLDSDPETPRPTAPNGRQQVEDPVSPRPKIQLSQNQQSMLQSSQLAGSHDIEASPCLDPLIRADGADAIAEIFANTVASTELNSALTNETTEPAAAKPLHAEPTPKKHQRAAGKATSMLFLRHHMRSAEPDDSDEPASKGNDRTEEAISGDEATRTGRGKEQGKTWGKVKRLTRDLSRSSMNLLMQRKAGEEADKEENDKPKKKRAKLKKECSSSASASGRGQSIAPGADDTDGAGTELHVLVETSVEVLVQPNTEVGDVGKHSSHDVRPSGKEDRVLSPTALDYHYDSDAASLPEIRDSVVERLTRAITQKEGAEEEKESLVKRERASVEIKTLIGKSGMPLGELKPDNPFELALPRSPTFSDLHDRLSGVRLSLSDDSRPSDPSTGAMESSDGAASDAAFMQAMKTRVVSEYAATAMQQSVVTEIEDALDSFEKKNSSDFESPRSEHSHEANNQTSARLPAPSHIDSTAPTQFTSGSGQRHVSPNPYNINPIQSLPSYGRTHHSLLQPQKETQRDCDAASVHLHLMHISRHLRSDSSLSSTTDLHKSVRDGSEKTSPPSDRHGAVNKHVYEGQNGKGERDANAYPFRRLAHHNASSASSLQAQKPCTGMNGNQQQQNIANNSSSAQFHLGVGLGTPMFPDLRDVAQMPPPPVPPSRVRGERRTSTSSSTNASALTGFNSSRVPPAWGHVLSNVPTHANSTAIHSRQASGGNASRYAGSSVYSSRYGGATGSGAGFDFGVHSGSGTCGKAYEPSSIYSTRANSPSLSGSVSGAGTGSGTPQPSVFSGVAGSGTGTCSQSGSGMKKSGYEIFEMPQDLDESEKGSKNEHAVVEGISVSHDGMPGAYPPTPGPCDGIEAGFKAANSPDDTVGVESKEQAQDRCESPSEASVYETPNTTAVDLRDQAPETAPSPTAIMIQCPQSPPAGERTPLQPKTVKKNRSAMNLFGLQNPLKPSLERHDSRRKSVGTKLSGLNIFRSKTMSNLRRAASTARAGAQETKEDVEKTPLAQCEDKIDDSEISDTKGLAVDGPTDRRGSAGTQALRHGFERHDRGQGHDDYDDDDACHRHHHHHHRHDSAARNSDPVPFEDRKPGRLSRALAIRDSLSPGSGSANQAAMWEKALKAHREEKSALFLSPEKGGKAKAQSLFRERSGSGSALRAKPIDEKQEGQRRPRSAEPNSNAWSGFGGFSERGESSQAGARFRRSETVLLDPLDTTLSRSRMPLHAPSGDVKDKSGFLGDELKAGHVHESASISPCTSPAPTTDDDDTPVARARTWDEAGVSELNLGDLGAWSRYPSHTRELRNNSAGHADEVHARDFAYEIRLSEIAESEDGGETTNSNKISRSPTDYKRVSTLGATSFKRRGKNKSRHGLPKSKSMTFGRNFLKHYIGLFRSQSEEFRRHGHGHRSSIAEGGILEHPELEILPPVWSSIPTVLESVPKETAEVEAGTVTKGGDGAGDEKEQDIERAVDVQADSRDEIKDKQSSHEGRVIGEEERGSAEQDSSMDQPENKLDNQMVFHIPAASKKLSRLDRKTDSSDASWKADARLWSKLCNSDSMSPLGVSEESLVGQRAYPEPPHDRKAERSSEWQRNVRFWTRLADRSQEFNAAVQHEADASHLHDGNLDPTDAVDLMNDLAHGSSEYADQSTSPQPRTSDEWRNDARLFYQMYESCVGLPQFGSTEDFNANRNSGADKIGEQRLCRHGKSNSSSGLRVSSAGVVDSLVTGREHAHLASAAKWRTLSGGNSGAYGGLFKNESAVSMKSLRRSTWDMTKVLD